MPFPLPTGAYFISNKAFNDSFAGHQLDSSDKVPIIGTPDRRVWFITHVVGDLYHFNVGHFMAVAVNNKVWGDSRPGPQEHPKIWQIQKIEDSDAYFISDPDADTELPGFIMRWTLDYEKPGTQISLKMSLLNPYAHAPNTLWHIQPAPDDH